MQYAIIWYLSGLLPLLWMRRTEGGDLISIIIFALFGPLVLLDSYFWYFMWKK